MCEEAHRVSEGENKKEDREGENKKKKKKKRKKNKEGRKEKYIEERYRGDEAGFDTACRHRLEKPVASPTWNLILVIHFPFHRRAPLMNMTAG